jgi:signal recognition particle subunit SRP54
MGDLLSLVNRVEEAVSQEQSRQVQEKIRSNRFTLEEFKEQLVQMKKMGDLGKMLEMIPGLSGKMGAIDTGQMDQELRHTEAILSSMTRRERSDPDLINGNRRVRIAKGSGTSVQEVNRLLKQFDQAKKMLKSVSGEKNRMRMASALSGLTGSGQRRF